MLNLNQPDTRYFHSAPTNPIVGNPAGLLAVGDALCFSYGDEVVSSVILDGDFVVVSFVANVEPARFRSDDIVWVRR